MPHVFFLGYWGVQGGANTEAYHTVRLWREAGWEVTMVPTWGREGITPESLEQARVLGCQVIYTNRASLHLIPDFAGSIVVGMCNDRFTCSIPVLRALKCKLVWVPCMNVLYPREFPLYMEQGVPDKIVYQSEYQRSQLEPIYKRLPSYPEKNGHTIHGAFFPDDFPFQYNPRQPGEPFIIGKLSRPNQDKWNPSIVSICEAVKPKDGSDRLALFMGVTEETYRRIGRPQQLPPWLHCYEPRKVSSREFLNSVHVLLCSNGAETTENWPRVGLEAMSSGVPLVVDARGGWFEMLVPGCSGLFGADNEGLTEKLQALADDEALRHGIAREGYQRCMELSEPAPLIEKWAHLFDSLRD